MLFLAEERQRQILSRIQNHGSVRVTSLANEFSVTEETIRRDLEKLDREGKLVRIHGGALPIEKDRHDLPFGVREAVNLDKKRAIASYAARYVEEGDVIALDASSTVRELARALPDLTLTVITNSLAITSDLLDRSRVRVVCTGGILDAPSLSYRGSLAEDALDRFHIRKLFISAQAVDLPRGASLTDDEHARLKRRMIDLSEKVYLLIDSTKFGTQAVEFFARLEEMDALITDDEIDPDLLEEWRKAGVPIELAPIARGRR